MSPDDASPSDSSATTDPESRARFRRNLIRVMSTQLVALLALWWLQSRYGR